jgi:cytoskeletal protein CcmA (bactofilin family)
MVDSPAFRPPSNPTAERSESVIDRESQFTGSYRTPCNLRIDGRYEGEIECRGTVFVGETASVNARIVAGNVTVAGQCEGEILCESRFEILRTGRVSGSVSAATTVVHEGAYYQGALRMAKPTGETGRREPPAPAGRTGDTLAPPPSRVAPTVQIPAARRRQSEAATADAAEMPAGLTPGGPAPRANGRGSRPADGDPGPAPAPGDG